MSVKNVGVVVSFLLLGACGPSTPADWMLGVYSNYGIPGEADSRGITHYEVVEDGSVIVTRRPNCGTSQSELVGAWANQGDDLFLITAPAPGDVGEDEVALSSGDKYVRRLEECGNGGTERFGAGARPDQTHVESLFRGKMCSTPTSVPGVNACDYFWCEDPPPCPYE